MERSTQLLLFGDQTTNFVPGLRRLLGVKGKSFLTSFLERALFTFRQEVAKLSLSEQKLFLPLTSIAGLLSRCEKEGNAALESVLTCIYQLGCFINYYEDPGRQYPSPQNTQIIGLCTGLLAAAAVSSSRSISELLPTAIYSVVIALRIGLCTAKTGTLLDPSAKLDDNWSVLATKTRLDNAQEVLSYFGGEENISPPSRPYISAIGLHSVTVTAPPYILQKRISTSFHPTLKTVAIPIHAPYHAPHLYSLSDVDNILGTEPNFELDTITCKFSIFSSTTGNLLPINLTYHQLLQTLLRDILLAPLYLNRIVDGIASLLNSSKATHCNILTVASPIAQGLATSLKHSVGIHITVDDGITNALQVGLMNMDSGRLEQSRIAIVGISGRFPDARNTDEFWNLLYNGLDVHREIPPDRFDVNAHFDITGHRKNTSKIRHGCWINDPGLFDARFFNISPREAAQADPGQRLALQTAYEALEMAGMVPDRTPSTRRDRVGVFYGMTSDDWREVNSGQNVDTYFIPGGNRAFTPGRLNYYFKFTGPSLSVDTACSSSMTAIHLACNSLWTGDCDTAIAGGTNVMTNPDNFAGLDRGHFLSKTSNCNAFDDDADGYCRADGVGTVILKRFEDAQQDRDPILGIILSAYTNHSAESVSITRPHAGAQQAIFRKLLNDAGIDSHDVSYIEMHGTGTQAGDAVEMKSVLDVFAPDRTRATGKPLYVGSAKANIGHGESASGVTSLIKVLLMMQKDIIPPHCGIKKKINHTFPTDLAERNVHIALKPKPWVHHRDVPRRAFVNNFSAAGGNSAVLLEDGPITPLETIFDPRSFHLVVVSGKSFTSLQNNITALITYINEKENSQVLNFVPKLSYTTTARRIHYSYRAAISGANLSEIRHNIENFRVDSNTKPVPTIQPQIGFVFTGQGAQYMGMGRHLYKHFSQFRADILLFDKIAQLQLFPSILPLIDGSKAVENLSTVTVQLGTTCLQMALARFWGFCGIKPDFIIGHSLGEYAALNAAGILSVSDTIYLCGLRAKLVEEHCNAGTHGMLAVKASSFEITPHLINGTLEVSCCNSPMETVVSGLNSDIEILCGRLATLGLKYTKVNTSYAFHSAQVEPTLEDLRNAIQGVTFHKPQVPLISAVTGLVMTKSNANDFGPDYLVRHCRDTVKFMQGIQDARDRGLVTPESIWIELGPHPVCSSMIKSIIGPEVTVLPSLHRKEDGWRLLTAALAKLYLAGFELQWGEYHRDFEAAQEVLQLPAYSWDNRNYWIQYEQNWTLTKGDPPSVIGSSQAAGASFCSISAQRIIEESHDTLTATVIMESDFAYPLLKSVALGHKVNGIALCPSSLYADVAQTLGSYLLNTYQQENKHFGIDVRDMVAPKPLIIKNEGPQLFRASMKADWITKIAEFKLFSVDAKGNFINEHAHCIVQFADCNDWALEWQRNSYLILRSIQILQNGVNEGQNHRIRNGMAYKLFASLVEYDQSYKGMQEIILDSDQYEATAVVKFQAGADNFHRNPFWIDSLGQLTGFVMNANDATSKDMVYVNHGWKSMKCLKKFTAEAQYRTYVKMQPVAENAYAGDLYVLEGDEVIALYEGVKFQGISRRVLDTVLPPPSRSAPKAQTKASQSVQNISHGKTATTMIESTSLGKTYKSIIEKNSSTLISTNHSTKTLDRALRILSEEIGLDVSDLKQDTIFADYGVDSLLSLTILGRFREDLDINAESSLFSDCPTVKDLTKYFSQFTVNESDNSSLTGDNSATIQTPADTQNDDQDYKGDGIMAGISNILVEEIGVSISEISSESNLAELGMDSLLSLTVLGRLREELDIDLPTEFFSENPTLRHIRDTLAPRSNGKVEPNTTAETITDQGSVASPDKINFHPPATSILLQGSPKTAQINIFLFPDGSGSATSYANLPLVSTTVCIYGLNCPYMKTPSQLTCGLDSLTIPYVTEIRRRQPTGPYYLGGWSAGGISAFAAAQHFHRAGTPVARLLLLDSPNPIGIAKLPARLYDFFATRGLFGAPDAPPPPWLLPHFLAFIEALDKYRAEPFAPRAAPRTHVLWATDGVCRHPDDARPEARADDPREMRWLLENRTDFGPNGWDELVGGRGNLVIEKLEGVNHFEMMSKECGEAVVKFLRRALE